MVRASRGRDVVAPDGAWRHRERRPLAEPARSKLDPRYRVLDAALEPIRPRDPDLDESALRQPAELLGEHDSERAGRLVRVGEREGSSAQLKKTRSSSRSGSRSSRSCTSSRKGRWPGTRRSS